MPEGLEIPLESLRYHDSLAQHRYDVDDKDIQHFLELKVNTRAGSVTDIKTVRSEDIIVAYLISYDNGWELLSADKRMPPVLAFSKEASFPGNNLAMRQFLSCDLETIECLKRGLISVPYDDSIAVQNLTLWARITKDEDIYRLKTKADGDPFEDEKYWELVDSEWIIDSVDAPARLIQTRWHQEAPWNKFSPKISPSPTETLRDPAGCSAIAVSQMLYFLHGKIGLPLSSPTDGYCTGYSQNLTDTTFHQEFYNYSASAWGNMAISMGDIGKSDTLSALLIGSVGKAMAMQYSPERSLASIVNSLPLFWFFGIASSSFVTFNGNTVYSSIKSAEMPVIVSAYVTENQGGHSFLADAYEDVYHVYDNTYVWTSYTQNNLYQYGETKVVRDTIKDSYVKMIWGYGNPIQDNVLYSINANHFQTYIDGTLYDFRYRRKMIYGFDSL